MLKRFFLLCAIIGTIIPWYFFASFFIREGLDIPLFITSLFANGAAGGFSADLLLSISIFWIWSYIDAKRNGISKWWVVLPAASVVGLSLALPLYLYLREANLEKK